MDNGFLTILFYIFIIVLVLSSIFRKKPKGTQQKEQPDLQGGSSESPGGTESANYYDPGKADDNKEIFVELENLFNKNNQPADAAPSADSSTTVKKGTKIEEYSKGDQTLFEKSEEYDYTKWPGSQSEVIVETVVKETSKPASEAVKIDSRIEKEARNFERLLNPRQEENKLIGSVRDKIRNPETLKEYIVFYEILGKPKSLRR